jgi:hypothetical protein
MDQFADLALAKLLTAAPQLGASVLNFSDVTDQIDDTGVQVGLFLLRTGMGVAYIPVVAKDETIFPLDSIFLEDEARFIPLTKTTIERLMMATPTNTGRAKDIPKGVARNPDLSVLMNPPRTGKYVYSSASRLTEFLAACPLKVQAFVMTKLAGEQSAYSALDAMFGLKAIFAALKGSATAGGAAASNSIDVSPMAVTPAWSVVTSIRDVKAMADEAMAQQFMRDGYVLKPGSGFSRVAVQYQPYNSVGVVSQTQPSVDPNMEVNVLFRDGSTHACYLPSYHRDSPTNSTVLFEDGSYAAAPVMKVGDDVPKLGVMKALFNNVPPKLLKDCENNEKVMLFLPDGSVMGPFTVDSVVLSAIGVTIKTYSGNIKQIIGSKNLRTDMEIIGDTMYVQHNVIVLPLGENVTFDLEQSGNSASDKLNLRTAQFLGANLDLRYDGISFTKNASYLGSKIDAFKDLVENEQIDPEAAQNFLKQAEEIKYVKIFLSKKASAGDSGQTEIANYGDRVLNDQADQVNQSGVFTGAMNDAVSLGDAEVVEATMISQLLASPDLFEMIKEYLPELSAAVDKLGRTLLLSRVRIDQLAEGMDSDNVFALIAKVKTTYKTLGDTVCRLEETANAGSGFDRNKSTPKGVGI